MGWQRTDDFDPRVAASQVTFGVDGKAYVLDLGTENAEKLRTLLQRYLTVAVQYGDLPAPPEFPAAASATPIVTVIPSQPGRRPARKRTPAKKVAASPSGNSTAPNGSVKGDAGNGVPHATIRSWANVNGYQVTPKGRIPDAVIKAYDEVHAPARI